MTATGNQDKSAAGQFKNANVNAITDAVKRAMAEPANKSIEEVVSKALNYLPSDLSSFEKGVVRGMVLASKAED